MLFRIYREPQFYAELLEANKENLPSQHAYEKSRRAVDALLSLDNQTDSKINTVIQYLLSQCEDITPLALQKALYYIQGFYYAFYKSFLFVEDCQAWVHGLFTVTFISGTEIIDSTQLSGHLLSTVRFSLRAKRRYMTV